MILSKPTLVDGLYSNKQVKNIEAFKQFAETSNAFVSFINKEKEKETQEELEIINNTMVSLTKSIIRLELPSEINSIFETSLTEQKKSAQLIIDNPKTLSELQNSISSSSLLLEEISSTEKQIKIAKLQIAKLTAYLQENMMSDLVPEVLSNLKILKNVITQETVTKLMRIGDSPSEYIGSIVEDTATFIDQELDGFESQLEKIIAEEETRITEEKRIEKLKAKEKAEAAHISEEKKVAEQKRISKVKASMPANAYFSKSAPDNWKCSSGYKKSENSCVKEEPSEESVSTPKYKMSKDEVLRFQRASYEESKQKVSVKKVGRDKVTRWFEDGQIKYVKNYKDGKLNGKATKWFPNGQMFSISNYKKGEYDGKQIQWEANGDIRSTYFFYAKENFEVTYWYPNGKKKREHKKIDGKFIGKVTEWFENGKKQSETNYKDGKIDGKQTFWNENGQKKSETNYKDSTTEVLDDTFTVYLGYLLYYANYCDKSSVTKLAEYYSRYDISQAKFKKNKFAIVGFKGADKMGCNTTKAFLSNLGVL